MKNLFLVILGLLPVTLLAQVPYEFRQTQDVKVVIAGDTLQNAWAGGLNAPVFSKIHLNNDNVEDLYVFERNSSKSFTFLADNSTGAWHWKYAPEYEALFPSNLKYWVLLRDFDGDGRKDIFTGDNLDYYVYRNLTPLNGNVAFGNPRTLKYGTGNIQFSLDVYSLPSIADVDNDGDMDLLVFDGGNISFFRNQSKELYNHTDSLKFVKATSAYGGINRCGFVQQYSFPNNSCKAGGITHMNGSSILALDLDADTDTDLLVGLEANPELSRFLNSGIAPAPAFNTAGFSQTFPAPAPATMQNYPTAYFEDVTFDGINDLLVAPFLHDNTDKANMNHSSWLYRNNAFAPGAAPVFTFQQNNFLQDEMIDVGESAAPVFFDIDNDGDQDLLVSNYADYRTGSGTASFKSTVSLFTNVGTAIKPIFQLTDSDYLNFSAADNNAGYKGLKLQFGDIDGNGSKDLIVRYMNAGANQVKLGYIPNSGQPSNPFNRANQTLMAVDIYGAEDPFFYDLDGDGDLDILMGTQQSSLGGGVLWYHKRLTADVTQYSSWNPTFHTNIGNIPIAGNPANFSLIIADLNNDNIPELITGDNSGNLRIYPNVLQNLTGTLTPHINLINNSVAAQQLPTMLGNLVEFSSRVNLHTAAADLDGDGLPELVVGTVTGGLVFLKNQSAISTGIKDAKPEVRLQVFPNPAATAVHVSSPEKVVLSLYDVTGKEVKLLQGGYEKMHNVPLAGLKPGIYFLKAITKDLRSASRSVIVQH